MASTRAGTGAIEVDVDHAGARALVETRLDLPDARRGKVRDVYRLPGEHGADSRVLMIATDRLSAFDVVLPTPVPGKGRLLSQLACWWLRWIEARGLARTHLLSSDERDIPAAALRGASRDDLRGRVMIGTRCRVIPIECVVRGYLEGAGWKEYQSRGSVSGVALPAGLVQCSRLPEPIFTPSTKAEPPAHDEAISFDRGCELVGEPTMRAIRDRSLAIYAAAATHALGCGIIIADTKFEFGVPIDDAGRVRGDEPILIDEALTPDSSRFWPADRYEPGHAQASFDKQFVREHLEQLVARGTWDKQAPGPELPREVVEGTLERYREACERLTGTRPA
ncbi:MAG: phosphoribosylaminoimidazolesuccinocarboxamide synthase [Phycisphaerales bacterium]|jgi:phosphoribosylaminoimidazole-succinocarboxamide synthase|nr:phosphoribosylaminoimidazolesuccinocarboxamide synthase [Phycisphaerales bacterium]